MVSKASSKDARGKGKESLQRSLINFHFCFAQMKRNTIRHWLKNEVSSINFDRWHSWLTRHKYLPYNAYWRLEYYDYSFLSVIGQRFMRTVWLYFLLFSLDLNSAEYISGQIRRLKRGCQENITIQNLSVLLCLKVSPQQKQLISYPSGSVGDRSPQEKWQALQWWINTIFAIVESNKYYFWWIQSLNRCNSFAIEATCFRWIQGIL